MIQSVIELFCVMLLMAIKGHIVHLDFPHCVTCYRPLVKYKTFLPLLVYCFSLTIYTDFKVDIVILYGTWCVWLKETGFAGEQSEGWWHVRNIHHGHDAVKPTVNNDCDQIDWLLFNIILQTAQSKPPLCSTEKLFPQKADWLRYVCRPSDCCPQFWEGQLKLMVFAPL